MIEKYLILLRELYISNFNIIIYCFYYNNNCYILNKWIQILFKFIPFILLKYISFINIIYKQDNIYNITNINKTQITPIITEFVLQNNDKYFDGISIIKYYNNNIPLMFFITHNYLQDYNEIKIKYLSNGTIMTKVFNINNDDIILKNISDLFL